VITQQQGSDLSNNAHLLVEWKQGSKARKFSVIAEQLCVSFSSLQRNGLSSEFEGYAASSWTLSAAGRISAMATVKSESV
jgi:hypothetical protein